MGDEKWPRKEGRAWRTSDGYRFMTANPENEKRVAAKAKAHQKRLGDKKDKK